MWTIVMYAVFFNLLNINSKLLVVDASGHGDFLDIQSAIDSAALNASIRKIQILEGIYEEKILLDSMIQHLTLEGKEGHTVIISYSQARDIWRCEHTDDFGAATVNVKGSDLTFVNLSI